VLSIFVPFNLSEFRQRKTLGASWRTLVGQHRNFGPSAIDAWFAPDPDPFAFFVELQPKIMTPSFGRFSLKHTKTRGKCHNRARFKHEPSASVATEQELSDFLKSVEKRAFKRSVYHVRDDEAALDIVQDSMMKLAEHYGDKPAAELPMLFHRILSNTTLDWFRRNKTRKALFSNFSDFDSDKDDGEFDLLEALAVNNDSQTTQSAEDNFASNAKVHDIEEEIQNLPARQREAFLLRYWEDLDVSETAAAMGCSEGSVKTHCSRAVLALSKALKLKGIQP
jgi:RNA polymerase sigma-70 factor (ECF subfamily)